MKYPIKRHSTTLFLSCAALFGGLATNAQSLALDWAGSFGGDGEDVVRSMHVDEAGYTYTTGYFTDEADFDITAGTYNLTAVDWYDVFVQKTAPDGTLEWAKGFGSKFFDYGVGITSDKDGNVYVTGVFEDTADFDPGTGTYEMIADNSLDIFVVKLDAQGDFVWAQQIGSPGYEETTEIVADDFGNVIITGYYYDTLDADPGPATFNLIPMGGSDAFVIKLDVSGNLVFAKSYGGSDLDLPMDMKIDASGNLFITGFFEGTADFDPNPLIPYNVTTQSNSSAGYVLKLDFNGDFVWVAHTDGGMVTARGIDIDKNGNAYVTGYFNSTVDFDMDGNPSTNTYTSSLSNNGFVMKIDNMGNFAWAKHLVCDAPFFSYTVAVGKSGAVYASGYFDGTADFDASPSGTHELTKASGNAMDAFLVSMDNQGNFMEAYQYGGCDFIDTHTLGVDSSENIYLSAHYETTVDIDPLPGSTQNTTVIDFRDNYLIKLFPFSNGIEDFVRNVSLSVYPNPTTTSIRINVSETDLSGLTYSILEPASGRIVKTGTLTAQPTIVVSGLSKGTYILTVDGYTQTSFIKL